MTRPLGIPMMIWIFRHGPRSAPDINDPLGVLSNDAETYRSICAFVVLTDDCLA
jgi:hypothetical protein